MRQRPAYRRRQRWDWLCRAHTVRRVWTQDRHVHQGIEHRLPARPRGLILKTILPAKDQAGAPTVRDQVTIDRYDYAGRKVAEVNANGDTAYWT